MNKAAQQLGRLGGKKTAERGPEYYRKIQQKSAEARKRNNAKRTHEKTPVNG